MGFVHFKSLIMNTRMVNKKFVILFHAKMNEYITMHTLMYLSSSTFPLKYFMKYSVSWNFDQKQNAVRSFWFLKKRNV